MCEERRGQDGREQEGVTGHPSEEAAGGSRPRRQREQGTGEGDGVKGDPGGRAFYQTLKERVSYYVGCSVQRGGSPG